MACEITPVIFHVVESTHVSGSARDTDQPYSRVVGLSIGEGMSEELWTPQGANHDQLEYDKSDTDAISIGVKQDIAYRLGSFFNRFHVEGPNHFANPDENTVAPDDTSDYSRANCHRFGYWMKGAIVAEGKEIPAEPSHMTREGFWVKPPLPQGKHAALGRNSSAPHSVVGLGKDSDKCVQVMSTGGPMGIDTYENVLAYYDSGPTKGYGYYA